ncbi:MAG: sulfatase-like hydrolase/transferase [Terriglobales bacterium]
MILLDPANGPFQGYDRGFDEYDAAFRLPQRGASRYQSVARHGNEVVTRATAWLTANKHRPFFLWVNLHDIESSSGPSYDRTLAGADAAAGKLIEFLRSQSLYDDAVIVMASDHGESLGAHGEETHGIFLYDETIHVPLMLKLPGTQTAERQIKSRVRLLDLAPTILEAAGVPVSSQMQGQSLIRISQAAASAGADQPSYARSELPQYGFGCSMLESWRVGKYLYIRAPEPELYDLSADPFASHNLAQSSKATLDTVASQLQALDSRLGNESGKGVTSALTSSEIQKLASLGYVGLQKTGDGVNSAAAGTDPRQVIALINKNIEALADLDDGSPDKAERILRPVLASKPNLYLAQFGMGVALAQRQRYAESIENLHKAIELRPDSAWAHLAMGLSLMQTGDFKTAAVHLEIASEHLPASSMLHSKLAEARERAGSRR